MAKRPMQKWAGQRLEFSGWWVPAEGEVICGVLMQKARAGGRFNQGHYVVKLTEESSANPFGTDKRQLFPEGTLIAIPDNYNLGGLEDLIGYEIEVTCVSVRDYDDPYNPGEKRTVKQFKVEHSAEIVAPEVAKQYGTKAAR